MTQSLIKGAMFGVIGGGLAACASSPAYPITQSAQPVAVTRSQAAPAPIESAAPAPMAIAQAAPAAVESQPLAPIQPNASQAAPSSPAAETPPPPPPPAASMAPPPEPAVAEPPPPRHEAGRYIAAGKVVDAHKMFRDYVVVKGDHLDAIARDLQTTREALVEANHLKKPDQLIPGQHLKAPIDKAYVAQSGDTLTAIAKRFDTSVDDLADLNALPVSARLRSGDQIALPAVIHDKGPVPLAEVRPQPRYAASTYRSSTYRSSTYHSSAYRSSTYEPGAYRPSPWALAAGQNRGGSGEGVSAPPPYPSSMAPTSPSLTDEQVAAAGRGRFVWPVRGEVLSAFGVKDVGRRNDGVDVKATQGTPVHAAAAGDVVYAGDQVPGFGNLVLVKHADGWVTAYAHLDRVNVHMRDTVVQNQEIGEVGQSGGVSEPQLHFEIRYAPSPTEKAKPIDPLLVLPR